MPITIIHDQNINQNSVRIALTPLNDCDDYESKKDVNVMRPLH
jgi:hypothetical protein